MNASPHPIRFPRRLLSGLALAFAMALVTSAAAQLRPLQPSTCSPDGFGVGLSYNATAFERSRNALTLRVEYVVTRTPRDPLPIEPLIFLDTDLIVGGEVSDVPCGQVFRRDYRLVDRHRDGGPRLLTLLLRNRPLLPAALENLDWESAAARYAERTPPGVDIYTSNLTERLPALDEAAPGASEARRARLERLSGAGAPRSGDSGGVSWSFLFDPADPGAPTPRHLRRVPADADDVPFGISLSISKPDPVSVGVTCFVDDRRIDAFELGGRRVATWVGWTDPAAPRLLFGRAPVVGPGWHRLECFVLNGLLGEDADPATHPVDATYLYRDE